MQERPDDVAALRQEVEWEGRGAPVRARAPQDVSRELHTVCELYELPAAERGVAINHEVQRGVLMALLDRTLFQRALSNLISNALTHTSAGR